jgi:isopenicillin N synthase-like dioxygenase
LVQRDAKELSRLLAACEKEGFFYLDLTSPESKNLYEDYHSVFDVMKDWFNQSLEEKAKFAYGSDVHGYTSILSVS